MSHTSRETADCLKITEDKSSKSRVQTPNAGLIIATTTAPRRKGRNPRLSLTVVASLQYQDARVKTRVSTVGPEALHSSFDDD